MKNLTEGPKIDLAVYLIKISGWLVVFVGIGTLIWYLQECVIPYYFHARHPDVVLSQLEIDAFKWGWIPVVIVSMVCIPLGIGIWKFNKLSRILVIIISAVITIVPFFIPSFYSDFGHFLRCNWFVLYSLLIIVFLNLPEVKRYFK